MAEAGQPRLSQTAGPPVAQGQPPPSWTEKVSRDVVVEVPIHISAQLPTGRSQTRCHNKARWGAVERVDGGVATPHQHVGVQNFKIKHLNLDSSNAFQKCEHSAHQRELDPMGFPPPMRHAVNALEGVAGEDQVGGPRGSVGNPRETCMVRENNHQTDGGQTDVSRQNKPSIYNANRCNSNDNGNASLRPRAVTPEFESHEFSIIIGNCKPSGGPSIASVFHVSRDNRTYACRGVYVVGYVCPRTGGERKDLRHGSREESKRTLNGGTSNVLLFGGGLLARREVGQYHLNDMITYWLDQRWHAIIHTCYGRMLTTQA